MTGASTDAPPVALETENPVTCLIEDVAPVVALIEDVGCGQAAHDASCLCDVDITRTVHTPHIQLRDMYLGREVLEHLGLCIPFTPDKLLSFFETQTAWKDTTSAPYVEVAPDHPSARGSKLPTTLRQFVGEQAMAGTPSPIIRAEVSRLFGIHISPSHMSQMRKRLVKNAGNL